MEKLIWGLIPLCIGCASVHSEIVIDAPPEKIWSVITDTASYSEWNPIMLEAKGIHAEGKELTYQFKMAENNVTEIKAKVKKLIPHQLLIQKGGTWGVLTFEHQFKLEKIDGGTKVTQHEDYSGLGLLFWDHKTMETAYKKSNEALKKRVLEL